MKHGEIHALLLVYIRHVNDFLFCFYSNKIHLIYTCVIALCLYIPFLTSASKCKQALI